MTEPVGVPAREGPQQPTELTNIAASGPAQRLVLISLRGQAKRW